jgi:NAD(P)-dependent dehydrogenase (short-subunit alcohol dehydrogenase family)
MSDDPRPPQARTFAPDLFKDQVVFITGGGTGLGLEIARGLLALGARVAIGSRSADNHRAFLESAEALDGEGFALELDVTSSRSVREAVEATVERWGRVDALVNNAAGNFVMPTERMREQAWRSVLSIALDGTFLCSREFGKQMLDQECGGQQLNVVATYAWTGMPGVAHSASAKAGVLALTRTLAREWGARGVRANAIAPGPFESDGASPNLWPDEAIAERIREGIPLRRFATAEEIAGQALFLLSPACAYLNGEVLTADGGAWLGTGFWDPAADREARRKLREARRAAREA